ncbi:MAG: hypothetical protein RL095_209 [Verrucomicrobiota bacterium]|jgi:uncharacterized protein (TIGR02722 family)
MKHLLLGSALLTTLGAASCGTPAHYVTENNQMIVDVDRINIQEFEMAAQSMIDSMIDHPVFAEIRQSPDYQDETNKGRVFIMVDKVTNDTSQRFDVALLTKQITVKLNKTGQVRTLVNFGSAAQAEAPGARALNQEDEFMKKKDPAQRKRPNLTLFGKILEDRARSGSIKQATYQFQLSLCSLDGELIWEDIKTISKQGSKSRVGF